MDLRKHQRDFEDVIDGIIAGSPIDTTTMYAEPGSGKSLIPVIACNLIKARLASNICWVVPRKSLQRQAEQAFQDPHFRNMLGHKFSIRASTNDNDPCRGLTGFCTTYQALSVDDGQSVLFEFMRRRMILVLDEFHHLEDGGTWEESIRPLIENCAYLILLSGTLERGDGKKISFMPYRLIGAGYRPVVEGTDTTAFIRYGRTDALNDKAIIPLKFYLSDGKAQWRTREGERFNVNRLSDSDRRLASSALLTAVSSEFAEQLIAKCVNHWKNYRESHPRSKLLVITAGIKQAKHATQLLKDKGYSAEIATSHEDAAAQKTIRHFRDGNLQILVSIAMAYEGLDVPAVTHECCLTHYRSAPWIHQMLARAVRVDHQAGPYESQMAFIFAPEDILFTEIIDQIRREQTPFITRGLSQGDLFEENNGDGDGIPRLIPIESELFGSREMTIGAQQVQTELPITPKDQETTLRKQIENHVRLYSFKGRYQNGQINSEIIREFGKSRSEMTIPELKECLRFVQVKYDLIDVRGRGQRVPTKAQPWSGDIPDVFEGVR